jgi:DNA-binding LacI/PurR family transcriptional regulator
MPSDSTKPAVSTDRARPARVSGRVIDVLADRIRSGRYAAGEALPTERTLATEFGVNRQSVRTAIEQLIRDGLITQEPNCRPTVGAANLEAKVERSRKTQRVSRRTNPRISASNLIALIMCSGGALEQADTAQQRIFRGMNQSLMPLRRHAVFLDLSDRIGSEDENAAREAEHLRYLRDEEFGGALFYPYAYRRNLDLVREVSRSIPLVMLDRKMAGIETDYVGLQNHRAIAMVVEHLLSQGHRRIAYVTRTEPIQTVQDRLQGYVDTVRATNDSEVTEMVLNLPPYQNERSWAFFDAAFRLPKDERPTAAVCISDYLALTLAERLQYLGLSIPEDVALTGFDNLVPALPSGVGLTTLAQPYEEIGIHAVDLLMRRIKLRHAPHCSVELPAELIVRESSSPITKNL